MTELTLANQIVLKRLWMFIRKKTIRDYSIHEAGRNFVE